MGSARFSILFSIVVAVTCLAQTGGNEQKTPNFITGRVITDDGQPAARIAVSASSPGVNPVRRSATTDDDGRFRLTDLPEAAYRIGAGIRGYVTDTMAGDNPFHLPGESVSITLRKGGVITGKVLAPDGEPAIEAFVSLTRIRDGEGFAVLEDWWSTITDDRGIYREYGLSSGVYVVSVIGRDQFGRRSPLASYLTTYYPSSTRDTAAEVTVRGGEEVSGIDIRWRNELGRTISGRVNGGSPTDPMAGIQALLIDHASQEVRGSAGAQFTVGQAGFEMRGVGDGDYDLLARKGFGEKAMYSSPRRLIVKGADVSGLELTLLPSASVSGKLKIDSEAAKTCDEKSTLPVQAVTLQLRTMTVSSRPESLSGFFSPLESPVDKLGGFAILGLRAGKYQLAGFIPGQGYYLRSISIQTARGHEVVKQGITLAAGDRVANLVVTVSPGASSLSGRVIDGGARRLRVHLVPKDREKGDQPVYYYESPVRGDNSFSVEQMAPGTYLVALRTVDANESFDAGSVAWDAADRVKLRAEAQAANLELTLEPCQRLTSYLLRYASRR
jgi:hypothetical protein